MPAPNYSNVATFRTTVQKFFPGSDVNITADQQLIIQLVNQAAKTWFTVQTSASPETFALFAARWNALPNTATRDYDAVYTICQELGWIVSHGQLA